MSGRVLIVDDEERLLVILRHNLEQLGYRVEVARDGTQALRILRGDPAFDAVVTDILMPECDGIELLTSIRKLYPEIKVIATSAPGNELFLESAEVLGADAVIEKPFDTEMLSVKLKGLVGA
jgi:CheY-like chemotaxis protein